MSRSIAIVIAAYNCEKTITKSLDSIRRLDSSPDEIIIVNDGSTDDTLGVLESYIGLDYKVISKNNGGCASARNLGFLNLSSDYVLLLDADDELEFSAICKLKEHLKEQTPDFVFIGETRVRENSRKYHRAYIDPVKPLEYCLINDCPSSCMVYKVSTFLELGGMDESLIAIEDWDFYNKLFIAGKSFTCLDEPIYIYNIQTENSMTKLSGNISYGVLITLAYIYRTYYSEAIKINPVINAKIFDLRLTLLRHFISHGVEIKNILYLLYETASTNPALFLKYVIYKVSSKFGIASFGRKVG